MRLWFSISTFADINELQIMNFEKFSSRFTVVIFQILTATVMVYIVLETIELIYQFGLSLASIDPLGDRLLITKEQTAQVLPVFFNILIAVELMDTFSAYVKEHFLKVRSILLIGLIAIGRKLLVLDIGHADGLSNIGLAAIILALALGYYLVKSPLEGKNDEKNNDR